MLRNPTNTVSPSLNNIVNFILNIQSNKDLFLEASKSFRAYEYGFQKGQINKDPFISVEDPVYKESLQALQKLGIKKTEDIHHSTNIVYKKDTNKPSDILGLKLTVYVFPGCFTMQTESEKSICEKLFLYQCAQAISPFFISNKKSLNFRYGVYTAQYSQEEATDLPVFKDFDTFKKRFHLPDNFFSKNGDFINLCAKHFPINRISLHYRFPARIKSDRDR